MGARVLFIKTVWAVSEVKASIVLYIMPLDVISLCHANIVLDLCCVKCRQETSQEQCVLDKKYI